MASSISSPLNSHIVNQYCDDKSNNKPSQLTLQQKIETIQQRLQEYRRNGEPCHEVDYQRFMNDNDYVKRFLAARKYDIDLGWKMIRNTLKWRLDNYWNISLEDEVKDYHFPIEFYLVSTLFAYQPDKNGYMTLYVRICMHRKVAELEKFTKAFLVHVYDKIDRISGKKGIALIFDLTNAGFRNIEWDYFRFLTTFASSYSPFGVRYILVLNLPWTLNSFRKIAFSFVSDDMAKVLKFVSGDEIFQFIDKQNVPDYLGGTCRRNYRAVPRGAKPIEQLVEKYGYSKADVDRIMPVYKDALDEADKCLNKYQYYDPDDWLEHEDLPSSQSSSSSKCGEDVNANHIVNHDHGNVLVATCDVNNNVLLNGNDTNGHGLFVIKNEMNQLVAFKVLCNSSTNYSVIPFCGLIKKHSCLRINIYLKNVHKYSSNDKVKILAIPVHQESFKWNDLNQLFTNLQNQQLVWCKLAIQLDNHLNFSFTRQSTITTTSLSSSSTSSSSLLSPSTIELKDLKDNVMDIVKSVTNLHKQQTKMWFLLYFLFIMYILLLFKLVFRNLAIKFSQ